MTPPDIPGVLKALAEGGVRYVLIGGVAVAAHGPVRATEDVDLVPDPEEENLRLLGNTLARMDAHLPGGPAEPFGPQLRAALAQGRNLTLDSVHGGVDVVQRMPGMPSFEDLDAEATEMELLGAPVKVCSRRHLRAMKLARGSHRDLADVEDLDALPGTEG